MNKLEYIYLNKRIENIETALEETTNKEERKRLNKRLSGFKLLRSEEIEKRKGVIL